MAAKLCAFIVWAMVAGSAVFWGLRLSAGALPVPAGASTAETTAAAQGDLLRLFGAAPVRPVAVVSAPAESTRFRLAGVVSPRTAKGSAGGSTSRNGVALIAVDGKPARAYRVGSRVDGDWVLQSVSLRSATVGGAGGAAGFLLEMPPPQAAATGTLPAAIPGAVGGNMPFTPAAAPPFVPPAQPVNDTTNQNLNETMPGGPGPVQTSPPPQFPGRNINNLTGAPTR